MSRFKFLAALALLLSAAARWMFRRGSSQRGSNQAEQPPQAPATDREVARIELHGSAELTQSKVGGDPYLPPSMEQPLGSAGHPMTLLAQVNFSEVPPMPGYPQDGILSFFIDGSDDLYGLDLDNQTHQRGFRVLYIPASEISPEASSAAFVPTSSMSPLGPGARNIKMHFRRDKEPVSASDYRCPEASRDALVDREMLARPGHKIGGYPEFVQSDPRERLAGETYELLFQLDSDGKEGQYDILWGDAGVGNFFIRPSALARLDFSDVLYNWDCA